MAQRSLADSLVILVRKGLTVAKIAKRYGVSERTIRRWKNQGVQPNTVNRRSVVPHILRDKNTEIRRLRAVAKRSGAVFPDVPVPVVTERIQRRDALKPDTFVDSDSVFYHVKGYSARDIFELMRLLRNEKKIVRIIYKVPKGGTSLGGREYAKGGRTSTDWERFYSEFSDDDLFGLIETVRPERFIYIATLDDKKPLKKKRRRK